jgi:hypothetical protein
MYMEIGVIFVLITYDSADAGSYKRLGDTDWRSFSRWHRQWRILEHISCWHQATLFCRSQCNGHNDHCWTLHTYIVSRLSLLISNDAAVVIPYQYYCRCTMKTWNVIRNKFIFTTFSSVFLLYSRASLFHVHKMSLAVPVSIGELTSVLSLIILTPILFLLDLLHYVTKVDQHFLLEPDLGTCLKIRKKHVVHSRWRRLKGDVVWCTRLTFSVWADIKLRAELL